MGQLVLAWSAIMSADFENQSPETAALAAAKSGFGVVEGVFLPVARLIGPASLWPLAVFFFGAVAVAAGIATIGDDVSPLPLHSGVSPITVGELPIPPETPSLVPASSTAEASTATNSPVQPVVLRGQSPSKVSRHL
jgi:hypothetical protein